MDKYFTLMIVPEREKGVRSFRIPRILFHSMLFLLVAGLTLFGIFAYDYWKILREIHKNKHLTIDNRQLKEQIQLFQMKINSLTDDLERVHIFEKKLRIITGLKETDMTRSLRPNNESKAFPTNESGEQDPALMDSQDHKKSSSLVPAKDLFKNLQELKNFEKNAQYLGLKNLYEQKIATRFGLETSYSYTKEWDQLTKQSFGLASSYAEFDYKFSVIKEFVKEIEVNIHHLDSYLFG